MKRKTLLEPVVHLYSLERQAIGSIYTQGGLLLTATIALAAGLYNSISVQNLESINSPLGRDILLFLALTTVVALICTMWNISKGLVPKTSYPSNKISEVVSILQNGDKTEDRLQKAEDALERVLAEAAGIYQDVTESRSIYLRRAFVLVIVSSALLGICVFWNWLLVFYGA